jgi:hypothetical protein
MIGTFWQPRTLAAALEHRTILNETKVKLEGYIEPAVLEDKWSPYWLPLFGTGSSFDLACAVDEPGESGCAPVYLADWEDETARPAILPSFGALIEFWIGVADSGHWHVGPDGHYAYLPPAERERLPLGSLI